MMKKVSQITLANRKRSFWLKISLIIALIAAIAVFPWSISPSLNPEYTVEVVEQEVAFEVVRTVQRKARVIPPPIIKPATDFIPEIEETYTLEPLDLDSAFFDEDLLIDEPINPTKVNNSQLPKSIEIPPEKEEKVPEYFVVVEEMPLFGDCYEGIPEKQERQKCSDIEILKYFAKNLRYPVMAKENGITGIVVLQFIVDEAGTVSNIEIVRDIGGGCGKAAVDVAQNMPEWRPGKQRNNNVKVRMTLPIRFELQ